MVDAVRFFVECTLILGLIGVTSVLVFSIVIGVVLCCEWLMERFS